MCEVCTAWWSLQICIRYSWPNSLINVFFLLCNILSRWIVSISRMVNCLCLFWLQQHKRIARLFRNHNYMSSLSIHGRPSLICIVLKSSVLNTHSIYLYYFYGWDNGNTFLLKTYIFVWQSELNQCCSGILSATNCT